MKITALVENISKTEVKSRHGLSLYIETKTHKILFDLGPDKTLIENARLLGIDLSKVDTVIISHGHRDHGGALADFLSINKTARIYIQKTAFDEHYIKIGLLKIDIGLDKSLKDHPQVRSIEGDYKIDDELYLFTASQNGKCYSPANDTLFGKNDKDNFLHEQSLIIRENCTALIMGCGHTGIVNIMEKAKEHKPAFCIGGYHLYNPTTKKTVSKDLLDEIISELAEFKETQFLTCHCTGLKAYEYLSERMSNISYLSCGEQLEL
ncbi:MBL fold metallo-hydrolase [Clostridiaceae bacterium OttesenSCG-928-D20]|nr:MBL fold metallo-hydrolase [Clostridiaceae bacterium OttesenSCG-928-D20]